MLISHIKIRLCSSPQFCLEDCNTLPGPGSALQSCLAAQNNSQRHYCRHLDSFPWMPDKRDTASILVFDTNLDTMEWKLDPFDKIMFSACNKGDNDQIANGKKDHNIFNF